MRRFRLPELSSKRLPDEIYAELVTLVFASVFPVLIMGAAIACVGGLMAARTGDPLLAGLSVVGVAAAGLRVAVLLAYRRRAASERRERAATARWDRRHAAANFLFAAALGVLNARALLVGDLLVDMLVTGLIFGYGSGLVNRTAVRPVTCAVSLALAVVPTAAAMAAQLRGGGLELQLAYAVQAVMIAGFAVASLETAYAAYRTTLGQLQTKQTYADLARLDALTGLPNRLMLRERFGDDLCRMRAGGSLIAIHFIDLDRFKPVNDRFGHPVGDAVLKAVAGRLQQMLRSSDFAARLGGDEFMVMQTGIAHPDEARMLAHRIIRTVSAPYSIDGREITIGASIGIAMAPKDGLLLPELAARADEALYQAKDGGRGAVAFWSPSAAQPPVSAVA
jgi:diguanylate cyclase (GGDEF)-like protein